MIQASGLGVCFGDVWVFRERSIDIGAAERIALVGESGSGKSLFLRCVCLLHPADEGKILFDGKQVAGAAVPEFRRSVMYLPQTIARFDGDVEAFFLQPFEFAGWADAAFDKTQCIEMLGHFSRDESFLRKTHRDLSGGEAQIAGLVRLLMLKPKVLLLDEPTSAMDSKAAAVAESLVARFLDQQNAALLWVTHDHAQSGRVAQRTERFD